MTGRLFERLRRFITDQRGGVSAMLVLMMIPIIAVLGMATEASSWFLTQRAMQNAADSAAIAAASNTCAATDTCHTTDHTPSFVEEAASVAKTYGFTSGTSNTTVATEKKACPVDATQSCYWVTITRVVPINLVRLVGYNGVEMPGGRGQKVAALAVASSKFDPSTFCVLALASGGAATTGIETKGGSNSTPLPFDRCRLGTNGKASCNQRQGADSVSASNKPSGCSGTDSTADANDKVNSAPLIDPYVGLKDNIPSNTCGSYSVTNLAAGSTIALSSVPKKYCGDVVLKGDVGISGTGVIVIYNGSLDLSKYKLTSGAGSGVTIIFTGSNPSKSIVPNGKGTLDIAAPKSGGWSGVALYTDPTNKTLYNYTENGGGNAITWNVSGLIYMPYATSTFNGSVNKATNGLDCFALVVDTFRSNGGVNLFEHQTACAEAGLTPPKGGVALRQALVQ